MIRLKENEKLNRQQVLKFEKVLEDINGKKPKRRRAKKSKKHLNEVKFKTSKHGLTKKWKIAKTFNNFYAR